MKERPPRRSKVPAAPPVPATSAPDRVSGVVWCKKRERRAIVSAVVIDAGGKGLRYVQWCSLIGCDVTCDEHCLRCFDEESVPVAEPEPGRRGQSTELRGTFGE